MQHISLTMRKMKLFALLLAIYVMPNVGLCQNAPQKAMKVDTVKQTTPNAVSLQKSVTTTTSFEVANPTSITYNDTALKSIQDTLNKIAESSQWKFLWDENTKSNSWIGFAALLVGILAAVFAGAGYWYQKKSAKSLKQIEDKRLPYLTFAKSIFDRIISIDIIAEIEDSSYTDVEREKRREGYQVEKVIEGLMMPDDLIDIKSYEIFPGDEIYSFAMKLKVSWRNYNRYVDDLLSYYRSGEREQLLKMYKIVRKKSIFLFHELIDFENLIKGLKKANNNFQYEGKDIESFESGEKKENRLSVNNYIPDTPIGAGKSFAYNLLCEYARFGFEGNEKMMYDPRCFYYDINTIKLDLSFPMSNLRYDIVKKFLTPYRDSLMSEKEKVMTGLGWILVDVPNRTVFSVWKRKIGIFLIGILNKTSESKYEELFKILLSSVWEHIDNRQNMYHYSKGYRFEHYMTSRESKYERKFLWMRHELIRFYASNTFNRLPINYSVLLRQIYAFEMAKIRYSMIDDELFYQNEKERFDKCKEDYIDITCMIPEGVVWEGGKDAFISFIYSLQHGKYVSLIKLIRFIIAEQKTDFNLEDLNEWIPKSGIKIDNIPCASLYPLLKEMKIIDDAGNVLMKNESELEHFKFVTPSAIYEEPLNSSVFYEKAKLWSIKNYGKSPFGTLFIKDSEKHIANRIYEVLIKCPAGTRDCIAIMAQRDGFDANNESQTSLLAVEDALNELLRKDGRFFLDYSAHDLNNNEVTYNYEFILQKNLHSLQDLHAKQFAQENGMQDVRFEKYEKGGLCVYTMVDGFGNDSDAIVIEPNNQVRMATKEESAPKEDGDTRYPWGKSIYDLYKEKMSQGTASDYEQTIVYACDVNDGKEPCISQGCIYRALEEAETFGMKVAIMPDPSYQRVSSLQGICIYVKPTEPVPLFRPGVRCANWKYQPVVVTQEDYDNLSNTETEG